MVKDLEKHDLYLLLLANNCRIFEKDGVKILMDMITLEMMNGATLDYKSEMIRSSFEVVANPLAESGCSCGVSFSPKEL